MTGKRGASATAVHTQTGAKPSTSHAAQILVVDHDAGIRRLLERTLAGSGYVVFLAANGQAALAAVAERRPDLVIASSELPCLNGVALEQVLHAQQPDLPILVMSALEPDVLPDLPVLVMPFGREQLLDAVRTPLADSSPT